MARVVVVTGAARGIGRGLALRFLQEGDLVVAVDQDADGLASLAAVVDGETLLTCGCDVASPQQVEHAFERIVAWRGRIDGLVNNAGIAQAVQGPPEDLDYEVWRRVLGVNLEGAFLCSKAAFHALRAAGGAIVNIASTRALQSEAHSEAYAASKGGLLALSHALAISWGPDIRVNAVSPGWIDTSSYVADDSETLRPEDHAQHPVGRVGNVEDVADMVSFLLSHRATFITGQNFVVDGGMTRKMIYVE